MKKLVLVITIISILFGVSYLVTMAEENEEETVKQVIENFTLKAFSDKMAIYYEDYSMIDEDSTDLKTMLESRNNTIKERRNITKTFENELISDDYTYNNFIISEDYAYASYVFSVSTIETSTNDYGEIEKVETGCSDNYDVLLGKNSKGEWKVVQARSNSPWNGDYLSEDDIELFNIGIESDLNYKESESLDSKNNELSNRLDELKIFKYDVSEDRLDEINEKNAEAIELLED